MLVALLGQGKAQLIAALAGAQYAYFARTAYGAASRPLAVVIDASIFPTVTFGNTNAPSIMVSARGAEFVLHDAR